jgi:hypothetical protein
MTFYDAGKQRQEFQSLMMTFDALQTEPRHEQFRKWLKEKLDSEHGVIRNGDLAAAADARGRAQVLDELLQDMSDARAAMARVERNKGSGNAGTGVY